MIKFENPRAILSAQRSDIIKYTMPAFEQSFKDETKAKNYQETKKRNNKITKNRLVAIIYHIAKDYAKSGMKNLQINFINNFNKELIKSFKLDPEKDKVQFIPDYETNDPDGSKYHFETIIIITPTQKISVGKIFVFKDKDNNLNSYKLFDNEYKAITEGNADSYSQWRVMPYL